VAGGLLLLLVGAGLWAARHWQRPGPVAEPGAPPAGLPEDPRLTYAGPFLNVRPDVAFVGDDKCAECHQKETRSFRAHPMGHSLVPIARIAAQQPYDAAHHNPFEALGTQFVVQRRGDQVVHRQVGRDEKGAPVYQSDTAIDYALGSGARGYSYLSDRDGYVFLSPVSWFTQQHVWDTAPGFSPQTRTGRPVSGACLFCHANHVRPRKGYTNRFEEPLFDGHAIGCERCHGPGGRHVTDPGHKDPESGADLTIVNPPHLPPPLREAVCEQCHITGEARILHRGRDLFDFRPGLPLEDFLAVYVAAAEPGKSRKAVGQVEQMRLSQCFLKSKERPANKERKLGCTSCHDPHRHVGPEEAAAYYRDRCLECHREGREPGCSVPEPVRRRQEKDDSCIACHMPRYPAADVAHTATTDHRLLKRPDRGPASGPSHNEPGIVSFYPPRPDSPNRGAGRDLGLALADLMVRRLAEGKEAPPGTGPLAAGLLQEALGNDPEDLGAQEILGEVLSLVNRPVEALATYEAVLARAPYREASLMGAAMLAESLRQDERSLACWRRAVAENPWQPSYRSSLAQLLARRRAWAEALPQAEAWVRLDPPSIDARVLWISCLAKTGDLAAARREFAKVERLRPPNLAALQARFAVELRGPR
jgi:predicted CXXCH cytochrome family protein